MLLIINSVTTGTKGRPIFDYTEVNDSGIVTLNCIVAKQVCIDDPLCGPTLDIVDRVCGSEVVSCSTVTVTKCQAALKTLQTFPFFNPTCLCREPQLDQKCNSFRTFLFDHPCLFANRREKDPYPIDSLVSCTHAHSICKSDSNCSRIYDHFKHVCRTIEDDKCIPELQEACKESWLKMRLTPMFGCICPPNLWQGQKKCDRHFNFVNHNRCAGSDLPIETNDVLTNFQSTCYQAMEMCEKNTKCSAAISAITAHCNNRQCKKQKCRQSLQAFYRNKSLVKYAVEVAFCLCKKTNNSEEDACMKAQNTLHPSCAQEVDTIAEPTCHSVAESCRSDPECGPLLEEFEQLCATDNYTKTCAGYPDQCRIGMLGILGTKLRTNCVCKGTDRAKLYECIGWQRVLWFNPCVVEAQREFHMNKVRARLFLRKSNVTNLYDSKLTTVPQIIEIEKTIATKEFTLTAAVSITEKPTMKMEATTKSSTKSTSTPTTAAVMTTIRTSRAKIISTFLDAISQTTTLKTNNIFSSIIASQMTTEPNTKIFRKHSNNNGLSYVINRGREKPSAFTTQLSPNGFFTVLSEGNYRIAFEKTTPMTSRKPVSFTTAKSHIPKSTITTQNGCALQKTSLDEEMLVPEGKATRFYHDFENDCSEMCYCAPGSVLRCQTECIQPLSCKTDLAMYKHGAPAYQAFRGRCLCYSAKFICIRPKLGTYSLPPGVFLYLGYSSLDQQLMSKHVNFEIQDSVRELQILLNIRTNLEISCQLTLFSVAEENAIVIAQYKNHTSNFTRQINMKPSLEEIMKDKDSCFVKLQNLATSINEQHYEIKTDVFLSIFKLAEVDVTYPETSGTCTIRGLLRTIFLQICVIFVFIG